MKNSLSQDWERVVKAWNTYNINHWNPSLVLFIEIYDLRKIDRGIDYPLRRLLDSEKYRSRIRCYGCTSSGFGRYPFRWNGRKWLLIRIKFDEK